MEYRVLGPIEVDDDGAVVAAGGPRLRRLLAILVIHADSVVSVDRLIEAVWGGDPPAAAETTLQTYVSRLRHVLDDGDASGSRIVSRPPGYVLVSNGDAIDARRFEMSLATARNATADGDDERAAAVLSDSLAWWRGAALAEFADEPWARAEALRLEELRMVGLEEFAAARLASGQAEVVVGDLERLVATQPLRARPLTLLMTALYRCGRHAEALRVFQEYRSRLSEELGLEPSRELRLLERQILDQDPTLAREPRGKALRGYRLIEPIAEGAHGEVWLAAQPSVGREVAIKTIGARHADDPQFIRRFETEAQTVARLEHPHIVPLYDYWREAGGAYLVMRYLRGGTLDTTLRTRQPVAESLTLVADVADALEVAHRHGVVHRELTAKSILLDADGAGYLSDFGLAFEPDGDHDAADDIRAMGFVLGELLSAPYPLDRRSAPPDVVRRVRPDVPSDVLDVIARATVSSNGDGFTSAVELADACLSARPGRGLRTPMARLAQVDHVRRRNPYKGLRAFQEADADDFHGRRQLVDRLLARLAAPGLAGRFVTVIGPSGSGKSSLVRAGLLPAIRSDAVAGSGRWFVTSMIPGTQPFEELESALGRVAVSQVGGLAELMVADERGIARAVKRVLPGDDGDLLLLIDQFEELFTLCADETTRRAFIDGLVNAAADVRSRLRVVLTLRADFYDRPLRYTALAPIVEESAIAVPPLTADELDRAIVVPAGRVGATLEPGLGARIVAEVVDQPGALPLLQYAMTELFERQQAGVLTIDAYEAVGGLSGALGRRAEELYIAGTTAEQDAARRAFTRLVAPGEGTEDTRRRVHRPEFGEDPATQTVIDRFGAARLLSFDRDSVTREPTIEVAHEALIREWPRLRGWVDDDREGLRLHRHLTAAAAGWEASGREGGELYRGGRLESAEHWAATRDLDLNGKEREFLTASIEQRQAEAAAQERTVRRIRRSLVAVASVAVLALIAGGVAWQQQRTARAAEARAENERWAADIAAAQAAEAAGDAAAAALTAEREAASAEEERARSANLSFTAETGRIRALAENLADSDLPVALLLAAEAHRRDPSPTSLGVLQRVFVAGDSRIGFLPSEDRIRAVHVGDHGEVIGVGDETITVWDPTTGRVTATVPLTVPVLDIGDLVPIGYHPIAFGGTFVAWTGADNTVRVVDLTQEPMVVREVARGHWPAIDRAGGRIAVPGVSGELTMYSLPDLELMWHVPGDGYANSGDQLRGLGVSAPAIEPSMPVANTIAFAEDQGLVLQGRGRTLTSFDAGTGQPRAFTLMPDAHGEFQDQPSGWLVSWPGDPNLIVGKGKFTVSIRDVDDLSEVARIGSPGGIADIEAVAPLPDGRMVVLHRSGDLLIVDAAGTVVKPTVHAGVGAATDLALSRDGRYFVVSGERGAAMVAVDGSTQLRSTIERPAGHVVLGGASGAIWVASEEPPAGIPGDRERTLARIWRCPDRRLPCSASPAPGLTSRSYVGGVSSESRPDLIFVYHVPADGADSVQLVDASTFESRSPLIQAAGKGNSAWVIAPDASWIALDHLNPAGIVVYSTVDGRHIADFPRDGSSVQFAVHPDGTFIVVSNRVTGESSIIRTDTWDMASSTIPDGDAVAATFSLDGQWLATTDLDGRVSLRDPSTFDELRVMNGAMGFATFVHQAFSDDGRYLLSVHGTTAVLWDTASGERIGDPIVSLPGSGPVALTGEHTIFLGASEQWIEMWHLDVDEYPSLACRAAGRNLTQAEWDELGPQDETYHATCPEWA